MTVGLAAQAYTVRHAGSSVEDQLRVCREAGFTAIESVGTHGLRADAFRRLVDELGLTVISVHVPLDRVRHDPEALLEDLAQVGAQHAVVPWLPPDDRGKIADDWVRLGRELDLFGARCREQAVRFAFHAHDVEMATLANGRRAIDVLLAAADPEHVAFEPDLAWIVRGGVTPDELLVRHAGRCPLVHVKDLARPGADPREEGWAAPGEGVLDWSALLPATLAAGAAWWIVEHDAPIDALKTLRQGYAFLQQHANADV
jgi:sugar phosphate isomerase/epimerase